MESLTEDQAMEERAQALQQSGHKVSALSLTFQRVLRLRGLIKNQTQVSVSQSPSPSACWSARRKRTA